MTNNKAPYALVVRKNIFEVKKFKIRNININLLLKANMK